MKRTRKSLNRIHAPRTFGELVTWAFDVAPSSGAAVELVEQLLQKRKVRFSGNIKF